MPAKQEPNIGLNYGWNAGESGINLQLDENWRAIGALLQLTVVSKTTDVPGIPGAGDRYIIPTGATGVWAGHDGKVARYNEDVWEIYTPLKGWLAYVSDIDQYQFFTGTAWEPAPIDDADQVVYNNATSGLAALNVQTAIDELATGASAPVQSVDGLTGAVDLSGSYEAKRQNNLSATTDPTVSDDSAAGYEPMSRWINTTTNEIWLCVNATAGAANWQKATLTLDELGSAAVVDVGTGAAQVPRNSDLGSASLASTTDFEAAGAVAGHVAELDPHTQYALETDVNRKALREALLAEASLTLDFVGNKFEVFEGIADGLTLKPYESIVTHTRGSTGIGQGVGKLESVPVDSKRLVVDPVTKKRAGLLIEEQRTNLLLWSEAFDNAYWSKSTGVTVTANTTVAPDGTTTGDTVSGGTAEAAIQRIYNVTASTVYTSSFYVKSLGATSIQIQLRDASTGVMSSVSSDPAISGWQRLDVKLTTGSATSQMNVRVGLADGDFAVWGAQLEVGSFPTSHIPTTDAQVTRSVDNASRALGAEFNATEGTLFVTATSGLISGNTSAVSLALGTSASGIARRYQIDQLPSGQVRFLTSDASGNFAPSYGIGGFTLGEEYRAAITYDLSSGQIQLAVNGQVASPTTVSLAAPDALSVGGLVNNSGQKLNGRVVDVRHIPRALSAAELEALTA